MKNRIIISGAAGFIGTNLCLKLLKNENNFIYGYDNLNTGTINNINKLKNFKNFNYDNIDITNQINNLDFSVDYIINLACPASPIHYQADPVSTLMTNVAGTHNLLKLSYELKSIFIQASTSEIYGDPKKNPQKESYFGNVNSFGPRSCYDEGKRAAESLCYDFINKYNCDVRIMRIFNTYGEYMRFDDGRVVSNFINQALKGENITIYGDGKQTRSFCYIDDLTNGIIKLMQTKLNTPVNLGNPVEFNMIKLAEIILRLTGSKSKVCFQDLPTDDPKQRKPDISLAKKILNWEPKIMLEEGLKNTISYFKNPN
tara:strand:- start:1104 stop:2045 length:942 start_codon:yes stop_codon:yes gene_type:complete